MCIDDEFSRFGILCVKDLLWAGTTQVLPLELRLQEFSQVGISGLDTGVQYVGRLQGIDPSSVASIVQVQQAEIDPIRINCLSSAYLCTPDFYDYFQCHPISKDWDLVISGHCWSKAIIIRILIAQECIRYQWFKKPAFWALVIVFSIVTDFIGVAISIMLLWNIWMET